MSFSMPDTITVGDTFRITIIDTTVQSRFANLYVLTSTDTVPHLEFIKPNSVRFIGGRVDTTILVTRADSMLRIICEIPNEKVDTSNYFTSLPGNYKKIVIVLKGETLNPGLPQGIIGIPEPFFVGEIDTFSIYLTDSFSNPVNSIDTVEFHLASGDSNTAIGYIETPETVVVERLLNVAFTSFVVSDSIKLTAYSSVLHQNFSSSYVRFGSGAGKHILVLFPGENLQPGSPPGKSGNPLEQPSGVVFPIKIFLVDSFYNRTNYPDYFTRDSLYLMTLPPSGVLDTSFSPPGPIFLRNTGGYIQDSILIRFSALLGRYAIFIYDSTHPELSSDTTYITVVQYGDSLTLWVTHDTVRAGEVNNVFAKLTNKSGIPVPGRTIHFQILQGQGVLYPASASTNESGIARVIFKAGPFSYGNIVKIKGYFMWRDSLVAEDTVTFKIYFPYNEPLSFYPNPLGISSDKAKISFIIPGLETVDRVRLEIYDAFGLKVWEKSITLDELGVSPGDKGTIVWDGKNSRGKRVATGVYLVVLRIMTGNKIIKTETKRVGVIW